MEKWDDLYRLLQIHPDADADIIQSAYKRLCKKFHPDVNPSPAAADMMRHINLAYETLSGEQSRRAYRAQWQQRNGAAASGAARVEVRERVVYVTRNPAETAGGTPAAAEVVRKYFEHLGARRYGDAFELVSQADKKRFTYGAYAEWQESVSALYEVSRPRLRLLGRHAGLETSDGTRLPAEEYTVTVSEKDRRTSAVSEYSLSKYAVWENMRWRVYLGYRDLTPLKMQFKVMASTAAEVQLLGLWERHVEHHDITLGVLNRKGFDEAVEREKYRFERYGRPFSLAVFTLFLPPQITGDSRREHVLKYAGYVINQAVRGIDSAAFLGEESFGAVLAETAGEDAPPAVRRVLKAARHDLSACFDFDIHIRAGTAVFDGGDTDALLEKCRSIATVSAADTC